MTDTNQAVAVELRSTSSNDFYVRRIRPVGNQVLVAAAPAIQQFGSIIAVTGDKSVDVNINEVLSVGPKANCSTRQGPVKAGDRVLSVRVVNRAVDSIDMRLASGAKVGFVQDLHVLAVLTETEIVPVGECYLVRIGEDSKEYGKLIMFQNADSLHVQSNEILACGPDACQGQVGEFAIFPSRFGVLLDSLQIRRQFGTNLKLIKDRSITGVATVELEDGQAYPENIPNVDRRLVSVDN